jgi:hypothetical protein
LYVCHTPPSATISSALAFIAVIKSSSSSLLFPRNVNSLVFIIYHLPRYRPLNAEVYLTLMADPNFRLFVRLEVLYQLGADTLAVRASFHPLLNIRVTCVIKLHSHL